MLRIYDFKNNTTTKTFVEEGPRQKENIEFTKKSVKNSFDLYSYYGNVQTTKKFIYGLYQVSEYAKKEGSDFEYQSKPLTSKQLHIFSWDGKPILKLKIEDWMTVFTVSLDDKYIYFVHPDKKDKIFRYTLPEL